MNEQNRGSLYSRRDFGRIALATVPAVGLAHAGLPASLFAAPLQIKPNSMFGGVQIGTITYSYRSMPDQSAEAVLKYILDSGISAVELMGAPVDAWARAKTNFQPSAGAGGGGRGGAAAAGGGRGGGGGGGRGAVDPATLTASWNGVPCAPGREGGAPAGTGRAGAAAGAAAIGAASAAPAGGRGGGRGEQTPEQVAAAEELRKWRQGLSMQIFKDLRTLYNDAGVSIYAVKNLSLNASDEDLEFQFTVAKTLGASHVTAELPSGPDAGATLKRVGDWALKHKMVAAYHTHAQGSMTAFDQAFAVSKGNAANVDFGHWIAAGSVGGTPMQFLEKHHGRIASYHLKDRTSPAHCGLNLPWGTGETPIKEILQLVKKNQWKIPASVELEYQIPEGSDAVKEMAKCVQFCKAALA